MKDSNRLFYVINEEGIRQEAEVLVKFKLLNGINYISYTYGEINDNDMIKIYSTGIIGEKGNYSYKEIDTTTEWDEIKNIMKLLAKDDTSDLPENNKSDLKIVGEEISIRKPKKLFVSNKFANTLASKYKEEVVTEEVEVTTLKSEPKTEAKTPAEFITNETNLESTQTINIPTFEELQARTKKVEQVMETAKPELTVPSVVAVEPKVEETINEPVKLNVDKPDYKEKFKNEVEPLLLDVYAKQQAQIEALEEELSKTKFDLFEKQKETLSLKKDNDELTQKGEKLESELNSVQQKMDGILNVIQGNTKELEEEKITE